jgi:hypothetical protein
VSDERLLELLAEAKRLAKEYRALTGRPLGVTGEVAEYEVARLLLDVSCRRFVRLATTRHENPRPVQNAFRSRVGAFFPERSEASRSAESSLIMSGTSCYLSS